MTQAIPQFQSLMEMTVRGFPIPDLLTRMLTDGQLRRARGSWPLRADVDYYGQFLETELGSVHPTASAMEQASTELPRYFPSTEAEHPDPFVTEAGHIPYIVEFAAIVEFGASGDGSPFCFDYRECPISPSVIWWDDTYWRKIAPTFEDFISLFALREA